jgi:hypothetical protein
LLHITAGSVAETFIGVKRAELSGLRWNAAVPQSFQRDCARPRSTTTLRTARSIGARFGVWRSKPGPVSARKEPGPKEGSTMRRLVWVLLAGLVPAAAAAETTNVWERSYSIAGRPDLHVIGNDGSVTVTPGEGKDIRVRVTTRGWRIGRDGVAIADRRSGDRLELEVRRPRHYFSLFLSSHSIRIEVLVPRDADLEVDTGDGAVSVRSLHGRCELHTGDGSIHLEDIKGEMHLRTGDGGIRAVRLDGALKAHTGDGGIHVDGRFDDLELDTGDGAIVVEAETGSTLGDGWTLHTGDGPLTLRLPTNLRADLDAHTGDGGIDVDLPVVVSGSMRRNFLRGTLNGGGPPLRISTGDGSIRIEKL